MASIVISFIFGVAVSSFGHSFKTKEFWILGSLFVLHGLTRMMGV